VLDPDDLPHVVASRGSGPVTHFRGPPDPKNNKPGSSRRDPSPRLVTTSYIAAPFT